MAGDTPTAPNDRATFSPKFKNGTRVKFRTGPRAGQCGVVHWCNVHNIHPNPDAPPDPVTGVRPVEPTYTVALDGGAVVAAWAAELEAA